MDIYNQLFILMDVAIAIVLGGILGAEREWKKKPAGLRTNMIIAGAAALFVSLGRVVITDYSDLVVMEGFGTDPIRMLHAVIVGVSFIGAGTILKSSDHTTIKYLTTSATILMAAAIGISIALKQYVLGIATTLLIIIVNFLFNKLDKYIHRVSDFKSPYDE